jgi:hypothetical protein
MSKPIKPTCKNITAYVKKKFTEPIIRNGKTYPPTNNISIYLPNINKNTFKALQANFRVVEREFMGYIHFEK